MTAPTLRERLDGLARWIEVLEAPAFSPGHWVDSARNPDGSYSVPYFEYGSQALAFTSDCARLGWVVPFDWMAWARTPDAARLIREPVRLEAASADDLEKVLTTAIRGDRFSEGELAAAFESGAILAVVRRARVLAETA